METIDIAINLIFENKPDLKITKTELKKLFIFATSQTHFLFNNKYFNQIDGVAMGSPLAPVLANLFMGFNESKWLNNYSLPKPDFYIRYVDDILTTFNNKIDALNFLNFLNKQHKNIKFTTEEQANNSIPFLDVLISNINNNKLKLSTYYKPTYTGLLLNYNSFTSKSYKISLVKCLIDRAFKISNDWSCFHNDLNLIKNNLIKNAYPSFLIDKIIKNYLNFKLSEQPQQSKSKCNIIYFKLPYIGEPSINVRSKFLNLCNKFCKQDFKIKIVFSSLKIKSFFSYKDAIPDDMKSFLVYNFTCARCNASYIGETTRHFKTRIDEHVKRDKQSHIYKHFISNPECKEHFDNSSFKIIDKCNNKFILKIKEALHINEKKPKLNAQVNHLALTLSV